MQKANTKTLAPDLASRMQKMREYPKRAPTMWHGMTFPHWWKLLSSNKFEIGSDRYLQTATVSLFSLFSSALAVSSSAIYGRRIQNTKIDKPPVFILGHWRSGTTYLFELLASAPNLCAPTIYQCTSPDHFLVSEKIVVPALARLIPDKRPQDNMALGLNLPHEDEFALAAMGQFGLLEIFAFPGRNQYDPRYLSLHDLSREEKQAWIDNWVSFLKSVTFKNDGKQCVLKTPQHTARIKTILEVFPDARFVHIARNPVNILVSTKHTILSLSETQRVGRSVLDDIDLIDTIEDVVVKNFAEMYDRYFDEKDLIKDGNLIEVTYEDLVADPMTEIRSIYEGLQLGDFSDIEDKVSVRAEASKGYKTNSYDVASDMIFRIGGNWSRYVNYFGYAESVEHVTSA